MAEKITQKGFEKILREGLEKPHNLGDKLYLVIKGNSRDFSFRYTLHKKTRKYSLSPYHALTNTLSHARKRATELNFMLAQGLDPHKERQLGIALTEKAEIQKLAQDAKRENTFQKLAYETYEQKRSGWSNQKHNKQWIRSLEVYAFPIIGQLPITEVTTDHVLAILNPIWNEIPETADRVRGRIEAVITRADALGLRTDKNPAQWRGHLSGLLTSAAKVKEAKVPKEERHHPALPHEQLAQFMNTISQSSGMGASALQVCILCATRTTETLKATWKEIDLDKALWVIPANRMKGKKEHKIPLSTQAVAKLRELEQLRISEYVFPNLSNGNHLSQAGMSSVLKRLNKNGEWQDKQGRNISVHGFRSTFRDYIADKTTFDGAMAEHALAHKIPDAAMAAYQRSTMVEKRRVMMQVYADYACQTGATRGNVTQISA